MGRHTHADGAYRVRVQPTGREPYFLGPYSTPGPAKAAATRARKSPYTRESVQVERSTGWEVVE